MERSSWGENGRSKQGRVRNVALACALGVLALAGCSSKSSGTPTGVGATGGAGATDAGATGGAGGADAGKDAPVTPTTTLFLVGDSTVAAFNDPYSHGHPRYGYGTQIGKYAGRARGGQQPRALGT